MCVTSLLLLVHSEAVYRKNNMWCISSHVLLPLSKSMTTRSLLLDCINLVAIVLPTAAPQLAALCGRIRWQHVLLRWWLGD